MKATLHDILESHRTGRPVVMGVLNVTPDSFSDGGEFLAAEAAIRHAEEMIDDGAEIIDVGAESTRPGSDRVDADEQIRRLGGVLPSLSTTGVVLSVDTTCSKVAAWALDAGAQIVNDVSAGREDPDILRVAAERHAAVVLMHMLGDPKTMQIEPEYDNVVAEVRDFLAGRIDAAVAAGVPAERCIVDPGIGFGKRIEHNLALLAGTESLVELGRPVLIGVSRKRFIGQLADEPEPQRRLGGTIGACLWTWERGATIFRVHDVGPLRQAVAVADAVRRAGRDG